MAHRYTPADVERAMVRYRALTGDHDAEIVSERAPDSSVVIYRVQNSRHLRGFLAYGAYSAHNGIEAYCNGFEDGRAAKEAPAAREGA